MIYFNSTARSFHLHHPKPIFLNLCYLIRLINNKPSARGVWRCDFSFEIPPRSDNYLHYTRKTLFNMRNTLDEIHMEHLKLNTSR